MCRRAVKQKSNQQSSIPSWQILTAHAQPFRAARDLAFCLKIPLDSLLVWTSSGGSGETARMCRLAWTFAARIGDKYQIRLTRPKLKLCWTLLFTLRICHSVKNLYERIRNIIVVPIYHTCVTVIYVRYRFYSIHAYLSQCYKHPQKVAFVSNTDSSLYLDLIDCYDFLLIGNHRIQNMISIYYILIRSIPEMFVYPGMFEFPWSNV